MAQDDNLQRTTAREGDSLSPIKRALVEMRRLREELESCRSSQATPIAVIGLAVRLPGGVTSPERFWEALAKGEDLISTVPLERWDAQTYWSTDSDRPGTMYDTHGGFLSDVDAFDADFFGISPREAASMDPQQRILLELTWEAVERAAIDPRSLMNTQTGIFLGMTNSDYGRKLTEDSRKIDGYTGVGAAASIAAGRLAYFLGTHGPAVVVDTACSSSLVAVHQAMQSLRRGETNLAIVGAANLILSPEMNIGFSRTRMLSQDGHCKTFDAAADGYVRAEGCCVIVLKRLSDAVQAGDRVLAKIHGTAVNQDGRSAGITAPNGPAQEAVMRAALADAGLAPEAVSYVEAHGTGTPLGDPMEFQAIGAVYGAGRSPESPLRVGSVKTNLGHTEAAAGMTGLIKVILMMQPGHGMAPHLHFKQPNPQIDWNRWPIEIPLKLTPWNAQSAVRYGAVSSFGFSGTNAHLIVGAADELSGDTTEVAHMEEERESLLCLSATQQAALRSLAERYVEYLRTSRESFHNICHTALIGRAKLAHRLALRAHTAEDAAKALELWLAGQPVEGLMTSAIDISTLVRVDGDPLNAAQAEFVAGGDTCHVGENVAVRVRRVDLPVYPFQRKRYWFGDSPLKKQRRDSDEIWQDTRVEADRQSRLGPLGWNLENYPRRWKALQSLTHAHARNVLAEAGIFADTTAHSLDDVLRQGNFLRIYRNLIGRWLRGLMEEEVILHTSQGFRAAVPLQSVDLEPYWQDAEQWMTDDPGSLAYLKQCGVLLSEAVTGRISALETLFPEGSFALAEALYETSAMARYFNSVAASGLHVAARGIGKKRNARILEIGGGTGGTTTSLLPGLNPAQVDYWFTDVSDLFLNRARRKFAQYSFVRYALFDIDRDFEEQGFRPGSFDLIVAANVIHAVRDLESALARVQDLLCPGGVLILLETTYHHSWFDMSIGLIEGWQHFDDADRQEHPLLAPDRWSAILERTGFEETMILPGRDSSASDLGQHVILTRRSVTSEPRSSSALRHDALVGQTHERKIPSHSIEAEHIEAASMQDLQNISSELSEQKIFAIVRETICSVFQLDTPPEALGDRDRLSDLGMDSLIALELRGELARRLGASGKISSTIAFDTGTVGELARSLAATFASPQEKDCYAADSLSVKTQPTERVAITAEQLQDMSDEEVEQLLKERLSRQ